YLGFNKYTVGGLSTIEVGGIILFDGYGRLTSKRYGFRMNPVGVAGTATTMAKLILPPQLGGDGTQTDFTPIPLNPPLSSFGFVLYETDTMLDKFGVDVFKDPLF